MDAIESLPILYVRARNHYDVGLSIGRAFGGWIRNYLETSTEFKRFRQFYDTRIGRKYVEEYLSTGSRSHPNIMAEIRGTADGAEVNFEELFLLQIASEIKFCHLEEVFQDGNDDKEDKGCTDILVNGKYGRYMAHNDDWTKDVSPLVYMVHVTITDERDDVIEHFVSFSYPGYLNGFCFGMNKSLVITLNSLKPRKTNRTGIPIAILLRSLLACETIDECVSAMEGKPYGAAYGMNINIASINGQGMCNMEVYPNKGSTVVKKVDVPFAGNTPESSVFFHQNHYKNIDVEEMGPCIGSRRRNKRANEFPVVQTMNDLKDVLGDTVDDVEPIYREPRENHVAPNVKTAATAIFDINNKILHVYRSNPKFTTAPCMSIPFL